VTYELEGCQKAVDFFSKYYNVRRMRIILNGRRVGNGDRACYSENKAYFTKKGLNRRTVLHEFYHHLVDSKGLEIAIEKEERGANDFSKEFLKK
jgi:hypothetical protein